MWVVAVSGICDVLDSPEVGVDQVDYNLRRSVLECGVSNQLLHVFSELLFFVGDL